MNPVCIVLLTLLTSLLGLPDRFFVVLQKINQSKCTVWCRVNRKTGQSILKLGILLSCKYWHPKQKKISKSQMLLWWIYLILDFLIGKIKEWESQKRKILLYFTLFIYLPYCCGILPLWEIYWVPNLLRKGAFEVSVL